MFVQKDNFGYGESFRCRFHRNTYDYPAHLHQFAEVAIVLEGEIEITVAGKREACPSGSIAFIPPFTPHAFSTPRETTVWIAVFSPSLIEGLSAELGARSGGAFTASDELFAYVSARLVNDEARTTLGIKAALYAIAEEYVRLTSETRERAPSSLLSRLFLYLEEHYREELSLESISRELGFSQSYISHAIGSLPNLSLTDILAGIRVEEAKKLLRSTDKRISEIALECGFGTERSFHRAFKSQTGLTPTEYRRR